MFERILLGLHEVEGVQATIVIDGAGKILASQAHAVYDLPLLQQVSRTIVSAVDSVQLVQEDWELVTATYSDGKVLIRNLRPSRPQGRAVVLAVIADSRLNTPFAGVAIRVAASKLKAELDSPSASGMVAAIPNQPPSVSTSAYSPPVNGRSPTGSTRLAPSSATPPLPIPPPRPELAASGLSWSGLSKSLNVSTSGVSVVDDAASRYLTACTKALSASVGPMAKVFVKEAVRRVCTDRPFSREDAAALVAELLPHIGSASDREDFNRALRSA